MLGFPTRAWQQIIDLLTLLGSTHLFSLNWLKTPEQDLPWLKYLLQIKMKLCTIVNCLLFMQRLLFYILRGLHWDLFSSFQINRCFGAVFSGLKVTGLLYVHIMAISDLGTTGSCLACLNQSLKNANTFFFLKKSSLHFLVSYGWVMA